MTLDRPPAPPPSGITLVEDTSAPEREPGYRDAPLRGGRLVLRRSWYSHQLLFMAAFCVFWDSFMVLWYTLVLGGRGSPGVMFVVFPLLHVAAGVVLTYRTLCGFINRTWITVTGDQLAIRHGPLPWPGNRVLPAREIAHLHCEETVSRNNRRGLASFTLRAVLHDGRKIALLKGIPAAAQGAYLEERIGEHLGIR